jgi:hypothetical protein
VPPHPEALTLLAAGSTDLDGTAAALEFDRPVWPRLKIEPPRKLGIAPAMYPWNG